MPRFHRGLLVACAMVQSACADNPTESESVSASTVVRKGKAASQTQCPNGGALLDHGVDTNGNGSLDDDEVSGTVVVCHGANGESCTASGGEDGSAIIVCPDGSSATVSAGADGSSCSVTDNGDGIKTIACSDGTSVLVSDGRANDGTSCSVTQHDDGSATISCTDGSSATVSAGVDGSSCSVTDNGDGTKTIACTDGSSTLVSDGQTYNPDSAHEDVLVTVDYPGLFGTMFPTYLSHLLGSPDFGTGDMDLVTLTVTNNSPSTTYYLRIAVDLLDYSLPATFTLTVSPGDTQTTDATPLLDLVALFSLDASRPGIIRTSVSTDDVLIAEESVAVTVASKNTAFLDPQLLGYLPTFVTPNDADGEIRRLLRDATDYMPGNSMVGYQELSTLDEFTLSPGFYFFFDYMHVADAAVPETVSVSFDTSIGTTSGSALVLDYDHYVKFEAGDPYTAECSSPTPLSAGYRLDCGPLLEGLYRLVYFNPAGSGGDWTVSASRTLTHAGITDIQMRAVYNVLRDRGFRYVNVLGDILSAPTQKVYYPAESIRNLSGNCIDGTVLFAAAFEAMGMRPYIVLPGGHAYVAIAAWTGDSELLGLETTMIGTSEYWDARVTGWLAIIDDEADPDVEIIDVSSMREFGVRPAPPM